MTKKRRKRHTPEQIVKKLRDADAMLNSGKELAAVFQSLSIIKGDAAASPFLPHKGEFKFQR